MVTTRRCSYKEEVTSTKAMRRKLRLRPLSAQGEDQRKIAQDQQVCSTTGAITDGDRDRPWHSLLTASLWLSILRVRHGHFYIGNEAEIADTVHSVKLGDTTGDSPTRGLTRTSTCSTCPPAVRPSLRPLSAQGEVQHTTAKDKQVCSTSGDFIVRDRDRLWPSLLPGRCGGVSRPSLGLKVIFVERKVCGTLDTSSHFLFFCCQEIRGQEAECIFRTLRECPRLGSLACAPWHVSNWSESITKLL